MSLTIVVPAPRDVEEFVVVAFVERTFGGGRLIDVIDRGLLRSLDGARVFDLAAHDCRAWRFEIEKFDGRTPLL